MKFSKYFAALAVATFTLTSHAGFLVEPFFGYALSGSSSGSIDVGAGDQDQDATLSGTSYGARLGYGLPLGLGFGIEYAMGATSSKVDDETTSFTDTNMGAFVSHDFPILLRAWLTYYTTMASKSDDGTSTGNGMKIGIGYTGLPFVSVNVEYVTSAFTESDQDLVESLDIKGAMTFLSISAPFDF